MWMNLPSQIYPGRVRFGYGSPAAQRPRRHLFEQSDIFVVLLQNMMYNTKVGTGCVLMKLHKLQKTDEI